MGIELAMKVRVRFGSVRNGVRVRCVWFSRLFSDVTKCAFGNELLLRQNSEQVQTNDTGALRTRRIALKGRS